MIWTEEMDARLRELRDEGKSYTEIGTEFGATRNAISGRVFRLGLEPFRGPRSRQKRNAAGSAKGIVTRAHKRASVAAPALPAVITLTTEHRKHFLELGANDCRYICDSTDGFWGNEKPYCGAPTGGGSWCPGHKAIVFDGGSNSTGRLRHASPGGRVLFRSPEQPREQADSRV